MGETRRLSGRVAVNVRGTDESERLKDCEDDREVGGLVSSRRRYNAKFG